MSRSQANNRGSRIGAICRKLASAHRRMGALHLELAKTVEGEAFEGLSGPSTAATRTPVRFAGPDISFDELARAGARRLLRQVGFKEVKR